MKYFVKYIFSVYIKLFLISLYLIAFAFKTKDKEQQKSNSEATLRNLEELRPLMDVNGFEKQSSSIERYPFALDFSSEDFLLPKPLYSAFKEMNLPQKINSGQEFDYSWKTYLSSSERNLEFGLGKNSQKDDSDDMKLIKGMSIGLTKYTNELIDYRESRQFQVIVNHYIKKYTYSLDKSKISLTDSFLSDMAEILTSESSKEEKIQQLTKKFDNYGYYVPLQIDLGGRFMYLFRETSIEKIEKFTSSLISLFKVFTLSSSVNHSVEKTSYSSELSVKYIGGDDIEIFNDINAVAEWYKTLRDSNLGIINYNTLEPIPNFFPSNLKELYREYESEIDNKYRVIYEKYELLKHFLDVSVPSDFQSAEDTKYFNYGATASTNYINTIKFYVKEYSDFLSRKTVTRHWDADINQVIIGFQIIEKRGDYWGGWWKVKENPILKKTIEVDFKSSVNSDQNWEFYIYYLDFSGTSGMLTTFGSAKTLRNGFLMILLTLFLI